MGKRKTSGNKSTNQEGAEEGRKEANNQLLKVATKIFETEHEERALHLYAQLMETMKQIDTGQGTEIGRLATAMQSILEFRPRDEVERMLVAQMLAVHEASMECFRRAMMPDQTFEGRDMNLKHAAKLSAIYTKQIEALDKHRGKGRQKITVEHVNVHAGGQAIVGDVTATKGDQPAQSKLAPAITDESAASEDGEQLREALSAKKEAAAKYVRK